MARKRPPSFDFYPGDFLAGTMSMEAAEVGVYIRLLCYQWEHDTIPNDERALARITGTFPDEFSVIWPKVKAKFISTNGELSGGLYNERLEGERQKKQEISEKRARAANAMHMQSKRGCKKDAKGSRKKEVGRREDRKKEEGSRKEEKSPFPASLDTPAFRAAWKKWEAHRKEIKKPLTPTSTSQQLKRFGEWGVDRSIAAIEYTIEKSWQGIREPDGDNRFGFAQQPTDTRSTYELIHGRCTGLSDCKCDKCTGALK